MSTHVGASAAAAVQKHQQPAAKRAASSATAAAAAADCWAAPPGPLLEALLHGSRAHCVAAQLHLDVHTLRLVCRDWRAGVDAALQQLTRPKQLWHVPGVLSCCAAVRCLHGLLLSSPALLTRLCGALAAGTTQLESLQLGLGAGQLPPRALASLSGLGSVLHRLASLELLGPDLPCDADWAPLGQLGAQLTRLSLGASAAVPVDSMDPVGLAAALAQLTGLRQLQLGFWMAAGEGQLSVCVDALHGASRLTSLEVCVSRLSGSEPTVALSLPALCSLHLQLQVVCQLHASPDTVGPLAEALLPLTQLAALTLVVHHHRSGGGVWPPLLLAPLAPVLRPSLTELRLQHLRCDDLQHLLPALPALRVAALANIYGQLPAADAAASDSGTSAAAAASTGGAASCCVPGPQLQELVIERLFPPPRLSDVLALLAHDGSMRRLLLDATGIDLSAAGGASPAQVLAPLALHEGLQQLALRQLPCSVSDLHAAGVWGRLQTFDLRDFAMERSSHAGLTAVLPHATALTSLTLWSACPPKAGARTALLKALAPIGPRLQRLQLGKLVASDLGPLSALTCLNTLVLRRASARDLSPLSGLTRLTWLDLHSSPATNLEPLSPLWQLQHLDASFAKTPSLAFVAHMQQLRQLLLPSCSAPSLAPLAACPRLMLLDLSSNKQAGDMEQALAHAFGLRRLHVSGFQRAKVQRLQRALQAARAAAATGAAGAAAVPPPLLAVVYDHGQERLLSDSQLLVKCGLGAAVLGARDLPKPVRGR